MKDYSGHSDTSSKPLNWLTGWFAWNSKQVQTIILVFLLFRMVGIGKRTHPSCAGTGYDVWS